MPIFPGGGTGGLFSAGSSHQRHRRGCSSTHEDISQPRGPFAHSSFIESHLLGQTQVAEPYQQLGTRME